MTRIECDSMRLIRMLFLVLIGIEILFVVCDEIFNVRAVIGLGPVERFFSISLEGGIASWFAVIQTWMVGLTAAAIFALIRADGSAQWRRVGWAVIALFFLYMSMDDGAKFHERIGSSVRRVVQGEHAEDLSRQIGFFPSYTWQLVFLPMFAAMGLYMLWFLNRELQSARNKRMVVAAIGLFIFAVALDFFEGIDSEHPLNLYSWFSTTWNKNINYVLHYSRSLEEFMEMLATSMLWVTFLRHLVWAAPEIELRLHRRQH